jgi:ornithine decarboxylase
LSELRDIGPTDRFAFVSEDGVERVAPQGLRTIFGPTCDSLDCLPAPVPVPGDVAEGDYVLVQGMGAYSLAIATHFNGYGPGEVVTLS